MKKKRLELQVEKWGNEVIDITMFDTTICSYWYETRPGDGRVVDTRYNNGRIRRILPSGKTIWIGESLSKKSILDRFISTMQDIKIGTR
jgi:hypothetical protein